MVPPQKPRAVLPSLSVIQYGQFNRNPGQPMQKNRSLVASCEVMGLGKIKAILAFSGHLISLLTQTRCHSTSPARIHLANTIHESLANPQLFSATYTAAS
jgi:hypothetical protein